jgi:hypothetical protein
MSAATMKGRSPKKKTTKERQPARRAKQRLAPHKEQGPVTRQVTVLQEKRVLIHLIVGCSLRRRLGQNMTVRDLVTILAPVGFKVSHKAVIAQIEKETSIGNVKVAGKYPRIISNGDPVVAYRASRVDHVYDSKGLFGAHGDRSSIRHLSWLTPLTFVAGLKKNPAKIAARRKELRKKLNSKRLQFRSDLKHPIREELTYLTELTRSNPTCKSFVEIDPCCIIPLGKRTVLQKDLSLPKIPPISIVVRKTGQSKKPKPKPKKRK